MPEDKDREGKSGDRAGASKAGSRAAELQDALRAVRKAGDPGTGLDKTVLTGRKKPAPPQEPESVQEGHEEKTVLVARKGGQKAEQGQPLGVLRDALKVVETALGGAREYAEMSAEKETAATLSASGEGEKTAPAPDAPGGGEAAAGETPQDAPGAAAEPDPQAAGGPPDTGEAPPPPSDESVPPTRIYRRTSTASGKTRLVRGPFKVSRSEFHQDPVVGWLVIIGGPGLGAFRAVYEGNNTLGRSSSQRIPIDFGDDTISAEEQAYIRYDSAERRFLLVPNLAKTNVVSLNEEKPTSAMELRAMDVITIGHTQLVFVPFCGAEFDWSELTGLTE